MVQSQAIMINGKVVGAIPVDSGTSKESIMRKAMQMEKVRKVVNSADAYTIVHIPFRIFNIVTTDKKNFSFDLTRENEESQGS